MIPLCELYLHLQRLVGRKALGLAEIVKLSYIAPVSELLGLGDFATLGATHRRIRRPPSGRVSASKDLTGEDSPSILLALFLVLPVWVATGDCNEPRGQSRRP